MRGSRTSRLQRFVRPKTQHSKKTNTVITMSPQNLSIGLALSGLDRHTVPPVHRGLLRYRHRQPAHRRGRPARPPAIRLRDPRAIRMDAGRRRFHVADAAADALTQANEKRPRENAGDGGASYGMQFRATFIGGAARGRTDVQSVVAAPSRRTSPSQPDRLFY